MQGNAPTPSPSMDKIARTSPLNGGRSEANTSARETPQENKPESLGSFAIFLVQLLIAVLIFRTFIFAPFSIPSQSMLPHLRTGDLLLAAKWPYGYSNNSLPFGVSLFDGRVLSGEPERGDVVIFKHPIDGADYIKRVIGLPGDTIAVDDGVVILNGQPLQQDTLSDAAIAISPNTDCPGRARTQESQSGELICRYTQFRETLPSGKSYRTIDLGFDQDADVFGPMTVPDGHMFVMGDNRDKSLDSRFAAVEGMGVGIVDQDLLVGQASIILWSSDGSAVWSNPASWFSTVRWSRIGTAL